MDVTNQFFGLQIPKMNILKTLLKNSLRPFHSFLLHIWKIENIMQIIFTVLIDKKSTFYGKIMYF